MKHNYRTTTRAYLLVGVVGVVWFAHALNGVQTGMSRDARYRHSDGLSQDSDSIPGAAAVAACFPFDGVAVRASNWKAYVSTPRPLPAGVEVHKQLAYAEGGDVRPATESSGSFLVYSNTRGKHVAGPAGSAATGRMADDIATTALTECPLDKYVVRVAGDRESTGGAPDFTVTTALYRICPGATTQPSAITGTTCTFSCLSGTGVHELTCAAATNVKLPENFYVGVSFNRDNCGVIVGAPAELGFSADRFDWPGSPCTAWLGGYPEYAHASFWTQIYAKQDCAKSFVGYKNSNHAGNAYSPGAGIWFADDIKLGVPECNMIAYEVTFKGYGVYRLDLRTNLSDSNPDTGGVMPRTARVIADCEWCVVRVPIDPPIPLPQSFYITFKTSSALSGPIFTNRAASLGSTADQFCVYRGGEWECRPFSETTYAALDVTIVCAGEPPVGACCNMVLVDEQGEAVCDELPQMNCGFPELWREGEVCEDVCVGGANDGQPCTRQADCPGSNCVGGTRNGLACELGIPTDCPGGFCRRGKCPGPFSFPCGQSACCTHDDYCYNFTRNECYARPPLDKPRLYKPGSFCSYAGESCPWGACLGREGLCSLPHPWPGCENPFCCTAVCWNDSYCCLVEWDQECVTNSFMYCTGSPPNDECWDPDQDKGARLVDVPSSTESDNLHSTENATDPGFCCNNTSFGGIGYGTVWYKFVATQPSALVKTCFSNPPASDSLISVYESADPDRGICHNGADCRVTAQNCTDGSECVLDEQYACRHLNLIGCSDDVQGCSAGNKNSSLCLTDLVVGRTYYVLVAHKTDPVTGITRLAYRLDVSSPCTLARPPMPNDYCRDSKVVSEKCVGGAENGTPCVPAIDNDCPDGVCRVVEPFDFSGGTTYGPATFDCPGDPCIDPVMQNDLWYTWTAPCRGRATATTCDPALNPEHQPHTSMIVYNACQCPMQIGTVVGCGFFSDCGLSAKTEFDAYQDQCYTIRLGGHLGGTPAGDLTVDVDCVACPPGPVTFVDPQSGTVDARQPYPPSDATQRQGIQWIVVRGPAGVDDINCWTLCETRADGTPNAITSIVDIGNGTFMVHLARTISIGAVTTLAYTDDGGTGYHGVFTSHPANVDADNASGPVDILAIINIINLATPAPWGNLSCDMDHSGTCEPADILRVIDLLNGAEQFEPWLGRPLPLCGACCP